MARAAGLGAEHHLGVADTTVALQPRAAARSVEELIEGATSREPMTAEDARSGSGLERVVIGGERFVLKHLHPDHDWTMRGFGDLGCRPVAVWTTGILDAVPPEIDHAVVGVAAGLGRNGWGGAVLLRDVSPWLVPPGDEPLTLDAHHRFLDHLAALAATFWGHDADLPELLPLENRWTAFGPGWLSAEAQLGWPEQVPPIARDGWERFSSRAPADVVTVVDALRHDIDPLVGAVRRTPLTLLHGDWKLGNVGVGPDGRTILLDWTYPGAGPIAHDLGWYLALNRRRLPEPKEDAIDALRGSLERRGIDTAPWWDAQVAICLLGTVVQFGWEKALGDDEELGWWCDRVRDGERWLA
jgi:hypothetical protein